MRLAILLVVVGLLSSVGCSGEEATSAAAAQDAKAVQVTTPDATAEDNAKALAAADMDPKVKEVLGGAGR